MLAQGREKDELYTEEHKKKLRGRRNVPLLLLGTSITERLSFEAAGAKAAPGALNAGVGGDTVANILYRLQELQLLDAFRGAAPKLVVLEGGANDIDGAEVDLDLLAAGLGQCMDSIRGSFPATHICLVGVFPRHSGYSTRDIKPSVSDAVLLERVAGLNRRLAEQAARRANCSFDGCADEFLEGGKMDPLLYKDEVHFSSAGYRVFAAMLTRSIQRHTPMR